MKDVLLIGNGPSAAEGGRGRAIDQFDGMVVRFNKCVLWEEVGFRTDVWVTWGEGAVWRDLGQTWTLLTTCENRRNEVANRWWELFGERSDTVRVTGLTDRGVRRYIGHPSAGALATAHFLHDPEVNRVFIFGFDHFSGRLHHYWSTVKDERHGHDPYQESLWFGNLVKQKRVTRWTPPV